MLQASKQQRQSLRHPGMLCLRHPIDSSEHLVNAKRVNCDESKFFGMDGGKDFYAADNIKV